MTRKRNSKILGPVIFAMVLAALSVTGKAVSSGKGSPPVSTSLAGFRTCVISRESGGDPQVWNRQGYPYWGLYQFGKPLWTANGGSATSWGHADAAEQTRIFYVVMSHYKGCMGWEPSDGCRYPANGC